MLKIIISYLIFFVTLQAHQLKENYLTLHYDENTKTLQVDFKIETRLFEEHFQIDDNHNGIISYKELRNHRKELLQYVYTHVTFTENKTALDLSNADVTFYRNQDQTYMRIKKTFSSINLDTLSLHYTMFFEYEKTHKLLIHLDDLRGDHILTDTEQNYSFSSYKMSQLQRFFIFVVDGFHHILDGIDHLLFIFMLLLSSQIRHFSDLAKKTKFIPLLKLITLFSLAHTITLFISAADVYRPNVNFIESGIALSIFIVALLNFLHKHQQINYYIVFSFGLLHGFGFANVLHMVEVHDTTSFVVSLLGFNIGVEIGQIFAIIIMLPLLVIALQNRYNNFMVKTFALTAMVISTYWFLTRTGLM